MPTGRQISCHANFHGFLDLYDLIYLVVLDDFFVTTNNKGSSD